MKFKNIIFSSQLFLANTPISIFNRYNALFYSTSDSGLHCEIIYVLSYTKELIYMIQLTFHSFVWIRNSFSSSFWQPIFWTLVVADSLYSPYFYEWSAKTTNFQLYTLRGFKTNHEMEKSVKYLASNEKEIFIQIQWRKYLLGAESTYSYVYFLLEIFSHKQRKNFSAWDWCTTVLSFHTYIFSLLKLTSATCAESSDAKKRAHITSLTKKCRPCQSKRCR